MSLELKVKPINSMASFYPVGTRGESKVFKWNLLTDLFICELYGIDTSKPLKFKEQLSDFEKDCKLKFIDILDDARAWDSLKKIYFDENNIVLISPKLRIYSLVNEVENSGVEKRFLGLLKLLFKPENSYQGGSDNVNFIESIINEVFDEKLVTQVPNIKNSLVNYFPNLVKTFSEDLGFITKYPKYFLENIEYFLQLYMYIYTTQLALIINQWRTYQDDKVAKHYCILNSEKASKERNLVLNSYKNVERGLGSIFPVLSLAESLQNNSENKEPLWKFYQNIHEINFVMLSEYCKEFAEKRELILKKDNFSDHEEVLNELERLFKAQFSKSETNTDRPSRNENVIKDIKNIILKPFIKNRGSIGNIFVLKPEYLLLLTNIAIGEREQLRLHELLREFEIRGLSFDKESQKALVKFYERLGNVEKMSDSGDAIYVKKTI